MTTTFQSNYYPIQDLVRRSQPAGFFSLETMQPIAGTVVSATARGQLAASLRHTRKLEAPNNLRLEADNASSSNWSLVKLDDEISLLPAREAITGIQEMMLLKNWCLKATKWAEEYTRTATVLSDEEFAFYYDEKLLEVLDCD